MTYEEFLVKLRETPREWQLTDDGEIRTLFFSNGPPRSCPGLQLDIFNVEAGDIWFLRHEIAYAADKTKKHNPKIRADILAACGLTEKEK